MNKLFICFLLVFVTIPFHANEDIQILVTYENAEGLTEKGFENPDIVDTIELLIVALILEKIQQAFIEDGITDDDIEYSSNSWCCKVDNKNLIIVNINIEDSVQCIVFIGIQDNTLIKITGYKAGSTPIPHSYGSCAEKAEEIFGISFK